MLMTRQSYSPLFCSLEDNGLGQATQDAIKATWGDRGGRLVMGEESSSEDSYSD